MHVRPGPGRPGSSLGQVSKYKEYLILQKIIFYSGKILKGKRKKNDKKSREKNTNLTWTLSWLQLRQFLSVQGRDQSLLSPKKDRYLIPNPT